MNKKEKKFKILIINQLFICLLKIIHTYYDDNSLIKIIHFIWLNFQYFKSLSLSIDLKFMWNSVYVYTYNW